MALSFKSRAQAQQVLGILSTQDVITTRGRLDRIIEKVKFPHTADWKTYGMRYNVRTEKSTPIDITKGNRTCYMNKQYDTIRNWLIRNGYLQMIFDGYRYHYKVTEKTKLFNSL